MFIFNGHFRAARPHAVKPGNGKSNFAAVQNTSVGHHNQTPIPTARRKIFTARDRIVRYEPRAGNRENTTYHDATLEMDPTAATAAADAVRTADAVRLFVLQPNSTKRVVIDTLLDCLQAKLPASTRLL